nr:UxaA family hydrolase [Bacillus subtilis]
MVLAAAPVLKVSTRHSLSEHWADLIDINAGTESRQERYQYRRRRLGNLQDDFGCGKRYRKQTWADRWGLHNDLCLFNPAPVT